MATYIDRARTSTVSATASFDCRIHVFPPDVITPDPLDEYYPQYFNFGSNQQSVQVTTLFTASTSGFGTTSWTWSVYFRCVCNNGFGTTNTVNLTVQSGTGTAAQALTGISVNIGAVLATYTGEVNQSTVYWDITQASFGGPGSDYPDITYNNYETANVGGTALAKVVISGLTASASGSIGTASSMTHDLRTAWFYKNNTGTAKTFTIGGQTVNGVSLASSVPAYAHSYSGQSTTATQSIVQGINNLYPHAIAEIVSNYTMRRLVRLKGRIRSYNLNYYDDLNIRISGFDMPTGYRDIVATAGQFQEDGSSAKYNVSDTLTSATGATQSQSTTVDTTPTSIYADIKASSLEALGDDSTNTKMLMRGWHFPGASVIQADSVNVSVSSIADTRTFTHPGFGLNSYRYLKVQLKAPSGTTHNGTISINYEPNNMTKSWEVSTNSATFIDVYLDLCSPHNKTSTLDETDHPYPRMNPSDPNNTSQMEDGDYWGITRITQIALGHTGLVMGDIKLVVQGPDSDYTKGYWMPARAWNKQQFTTYGGNTYTTNRLYLGDCQGNSMSEEGWAIWKSSPSTNTISTIANFVDAMNAVDGTVKRHQGYTASASTPLASAGYIRDGYCNSTTGHAYWLGGTTFRKVGGSAEIKNWVETDQSHDGPEAQVFAQTYFRSINGNFVPDIFDVFEQDDAGSLWLSIGCVSYQRGRSHGLVLATDADPLEAETVQLVLDSDGSIRGSGVSDVIGRYYTAQPMGLGQKNHNTICLAQNSGDPDPLYDNKTYRFVFKNPAPAGHVFSADRNPVYEHFYATVQSGDVSLWRANGPLGTDYVETPTTITGVTDLAIRCLRRDADFGTIIFTQESSGLKRYYTSNDGGTVSVATVINSTGSHPALVVDNQGQEIYIWRTSGSDIQSKILDASGTVVMATTTVVSGSVANDSIAIYERLDDLYIVYNHQSNGITVVRSVDGGRTYA